jgi:hypothetical protein
MDKKNVAPSGTLLWISNNSFPHNFDIWNLFFLTNNRLNHACIYGKWIYSRLSEVLDILVVCLSPNFDDFSVFFAEMFTISSDHPDLGSETKTVCNAAKGKKRLIWTTGYFGRWIGEWATIVTKQKLLRDFFDFFPQWRSLLRVCKAGLTFVPAFISCAQVCTAWPNQSVTGNNGTHFTV